MFFDLLILIGRFSMVGTSLLNAKRRLLCLLAKASDFFLSMNFPNINVSNKNKHSIIFFHSFDCDVEQTSLVVLDII